jgi:hypothetical protein
MAKATTKINITATIPRSLDIIRNQKPDITLNSLKIRVLTKAWLAVLLVVFWDMKSAMEIPLLQDLALQLGLTLATGSQEGGNFNFLRNTKGDPLLSFLEGSSFSYFYKNDYRFLIRRVNRNDTALPALLRLSTSSY